MASASSPVSQLPSYKLSLLNACVSANVLTFGTYTLKSGRISPYFFNAGLLHTATLLSTLGDAYAATILAFTSNALHSTPSSNEASTHAFASFDVIFGPSYKGIALAIETLGALRRIRPETYGEVSYAFNRKEKKDHGEGGAIVGASLKGKRVLVVDDVVTAGTALREAVGIIEGEGGKVVGVVVALDRMERMPSRAELEGRAVDGGVEEEGPRRSAVQELRRGLGVPVLAVLTLDDLIGFSQEGRSGEELKALERYREKYIAKE